MNEATDQATATVAEEVVESVGLREDLSLAVSLNESGIKDEDGVVRVSACLIESGWSVNKRYYSSSLLKKLAPLLEGAGSLNGHIATPSVADYNGVYRNVRFAEGAGPTGRDAVIGEFNVIDPHLQRIVKHAPHLVKLSINGKGKVVRGTAEGQEGFIVEDVWNEIPWTCDTVFRAGARGGIGAVLEALEINGGSNMDLTSVQDLKNAYPALLKEYAEEVRTSVAGDLQEQGKIAGLEADLKEAHDELAKAVQGRDAAQHKIAVLESQGLLEKKLGESKLHESLKKRVREHFADKIAEEAAVAAELKDYEDLAASLAETPKVSGVVEESDESAHDSDWALLQDVLGVKDGDK